MSEEKAIEIAKSADLVLNGYAVTRDGENFKVVNGKIVESWGYWPDKEIEEKLR